MTNASSAEVSKNFSHFREVAEGVRGTEPEAVTVLHYNKPSVVILSAAEYQRLKKRDKKALFIEELPEDLIAMIAESKMNTED